ncbi:hypothetical protein CVE36_10450 [Pseudomonas syringae pv. actinidiae]|nr:hypothetical protein [Pseudomonas syringae pv. actinidiae]
MLYSPDPAVFEKFRLFYLRMSGMGFDAAALGMLQEPARQSIRFFGLNFEAAPHMTGRRIVRQYLPSASFL